MKAKFLVWRKKQEAEVRVEEERQRDSLGDDPSENNSNLLINLVVNNETDRLGNPDPAEVSVNGVGAGNTKQPKEKAGCIFCRDDYNIVQDFDEDLKTRKYEDSPYRPREKQEKNYRSRLEHL